MCVKGLSLKLYFVEKVAIASVMLVARPGLVLEIVGMGDVPLVEVNILLLSGFLFLMKQPKDIPRSLNCRQRKEKEVFKWDYS